MSRSLRYRLVCSSAIATLAFATSALAQGPSGAAVEEIVVTGTSIRGVAPVGANLITVDRAAIEKTGAQTMQQILKTVPAVTGFGNAGQGGFGVAGDVFAPTIHSLGQNASNSTLVLVDGHRFPLTGVNNNLPDPNLIPSIALQRV
jgi:iron complex outermembrane receptor protein